MKAKEVYDSALHALNIPEEAKSPVSPVSPVDIIVPTGPPQCSSSDQLELALKAELGDHFEQLINKNKLQRAQDSLSSSLVEKSNLNHEKVSEFKDRGPELK